MKAQPDTAPGPLAEAVARLVRGYQLAISPLMAPSCRYWPSCSEYTIESLRTHGVLRGGWFAARRLARCHPWCAGGVDLVPAAVSGPVSAGCAPSSASAPAPAAGRAPASSRPAATASAGASSRAIDPALPIDATGSRSSYARGTAQVARPLDT